MLLTTKVPKINLLEEEKINAGAIASLLKEPIIITYTLAIFFYAGAEAGASSYIVVFMERVHGYGTNISLLDKGTFMYLAFPSASALVVGLFWLAQVIDRLIIGQMIRFILSRTVFIIHSDATCIAVIVEAVSPPEIALTVFNRVAVIGFLVGMVGDAFGMQQ